MQPAGSATGLGGGMREPEKAALRMELPFTKVRRTVRSEEAGLRVSGVRTKLEMPV